MAREAICSALARVKTGQVSRVITRGSLVQSVELKRSRSCQRWTPLSTMLFADNYLGINDSKERLQKLIDVANSYC